MQSFFLVRIMTSEVDSPLFVNYLLPASDIVSARSLAFHRFGAERVCAVESVIFASVLPNDCEQDKS